MTTPDITDRLRATPRSDIREVMNEAAAEIERLRLTDAEREAVEYAAASIHDQGLHRMSASMVAYAATLRGLLERCSQFAKRESDRPQPIADARLAALQQLAELDEELGLPRCTPNPHATPGECSVPPGR